MIIKNNKFNFILNFCEKFERYEQQLAPNS